MAFLVVIRLTHVQYTLRGSVKNPLPRLFSIGHHLFSNKARGTETYCNHSSIEGCIIISLCKPITSILSPISGTYTFSLETCHPSRKLVKDTRAESLISTWNFHRTSATCLFMHVYTADCSDLVGHITINQAVTCHYGKDNKKKRLAALSTNSLVVEVSNRWTKRLLWIEATIQTSRPNFPQKSDSRAKYTSRLMRKNIACRGKIMPVFQLVKQVEWREPLLTIVDSKLLKQKSIGYQSIVSQKQSHKQKYCDQFATVVYWPSLARLQARGRLNISNTFDTGLSKDSDESHLCVLHSWTSVTARSPMTMEDSYCRKPPRIIG